MENYSIEYQTLKKKLLEKIGIFHISPFLLNSSLEIFLKPSKTENLKEIKLDLEKDFGRKMQNPEFIKVLEKDLEKLLTQIGKSYSLHKENGIYTIYFSPITTRPKNIEKIGDDIYEQAIFEIENFEKPDQNKGFNTNFYWVSFENSSVLSLELGKILQIENYILEKLKKDIKNYQVTRVFVGKNETNENENIKIYFKEI